MFTPKPSSARICPLCKYNKSHMHATHHCLLLLIDCFEFSREAIQFLQALNNSYPCLDTDAAVETARGDGNNGNLSSSSASRAGQGSFVLFLPVRVQLRQAGVVASRHCTNARDCASVSLSHLSFWYVVINLSLARALARTFPQKGQRTHIFDEVFVRSFQVCNRPLVFTSSGSKFGFWVSR